MQISQNVIESSIEHTQELLRPILTSTKGQKKDIQRLDGGIFLEIVALKILIPIFLFLTNTLLKRKIFPDKTSSKSLDELKKELNTSVGQPIGNIDETQKKELIKLVNSEIEKFGGTKEQSEEIVESILQSIQKGDKK